MVHCHACGTALQGTEPRCPACGMPQADPTLPSGTKLNGGRYTVGRMLGQGGFGITYAGADTTLGRRVAIKEFFPDGSSRHTGLLVPPTSLGQEGLRGALDAFLEEARTLAQFNHPGIVDVLDVFEENFTAYLVMEFLEGETLGGRIEKRGALPPEEVRSLALAVADALRVVHRAGLLHRDLKPDNLFLTEDGRAVLIDFGSARAYSGGKTVSHTRLVTPGYAPLEQYSSQAKFGPYTDLYALAATLYHALTGTQPPAATDRLVGSGELPPLPAGVPSGLRAALEQALAIRIDERPGSVDDFVKLLQEEARPERAPTPAPAAPRPEAARDAGRYDLVLQDPGPLAFLVVRELARFLRLDYRQVERLVRSGGPLLRGVSRLEAERLRTVLEAMGARAVTVFAGSAPSQARRSPAPLPPRPAPPPRAPQPQVWRTAGGCSTFALGCLLFLLLLLFMSSGGIFYFY